MIILLPSPPPPPVGNNERARVNCTKISPLQKTTQASRLSDSGLLGPISCLRSQVCDLLSGGACLQRGSKADSQLSPLYGSSWGTSSPRSGFRTESLGRSCTGWFRPGLCAAHSRHSPRSGAEPARFHTLKGVNDVPSWSHGWKNSQQSNEQIEFWGAPCGHKRHFQSLL